MALLVDVKVKVQYLFGHLAMEVVIQIPVIAMDTQIQYSHCQFLVLPKGATNHGI